MWQKHHLIVLYLSHDKHKTLSQHPGILPRLQLHNELDTRNTLLVRIHRLINTLQPTRDNVHSVRQQLARGQLLAKGLIHRLNHVSELRMPPQREKPADLDSTFSDQTSINSLHTRLKDRHDDRPGSSLVDSLDDLHSLGLRLVLVDGEIHRVKLDISADRVDKVLHAIFHGSV